MDWRMIASLAVASIATALLREGSASHIGWVPCVLIFIAIAWLTNKILSLTKKREKPGFPANPEHSALSSEPGESPKLEPKPSVLQSLKVMTSSRSRMLLLAGGCLLILFAVLVLFSSGKPSSQYPAFPILNNIPVEGVLIDDGNAESLVTVKFGKFSQEQFDSLDLPGIASEQIDYLCNAPEAGKYWEKNDKIQVKFENGAGETLFSFNVDGSCRK